LSSARGSTLELWNSNDDDDGDGDRQRVSGGAFGVIVLMSTA